MCCCLFLIRGVGVIQVFVFGCGLMVWLGALQGFDFVGVTVGFRHVRDTSWLMGFG